MGKNQSFRTLKGMDRQDLIELIRTLSEENERLLEETVRLGGENERLGAICETLRDAEGRLQEASARDRDALDAAGALPRSLEKEITALRKSVRALRESVDAAVDCFRARSESDHGRESEADA